ncbi:hypothetical protein KM043_015003 [Ampulex compressa]|nr:hypothetical protein KM043_015003 [Ampulex compressa]
MPGAERANGGTIVVIVSGCERGKRKRSTGAVIPWLEQHFLTPPLRSSRFPLTDTDMGTVHCLSYLDRATFRGDEPSKENLGKPLTTLIADCAICE